MRLLPFLLASLGAAGSAAPSACAQPSAEPRTEASAQASAQVSEASPYPAALVVEGLTARLYAPQHRAGKRGALGLAIHTDAAGRETAHVGHGSTNSRTPTLALVVDLGSGRASVVREDGGLEPLPEAFEARREGFDGAVFKMRTEGTIPATTDRGVVYLDFDPLTSGTEAYTFVEGAAPRAQRIAGVGHNRDVAAAGPIVVAHTTGALGREASAWPRLTGSTDGGLSWAPVTAAGEARFEGNGFLRLATFGGEVYGFPATLQGDTAPPVFVVDRRAEGGLVARPLFETAEGYWPSGSSTAVAFQGRQVITWPQVHRGYEADGGLYLHTVDGLYFTPDPARTRPVAVEPAPAAPPARNERAGARLVYAAHAGSLYALVPGPRGEAARLLRRAGGASEAGRWEEVTPVGGPGGGPLPFVPQVLAISPSGALVALGAAPDGDLALATVPAQALRPSLSAR